MSKIIGEPITVHVTKESDVASFIWRRRIYSVIYIISSWWEPAEWWDKQPERFLLRVNASASTTSGIYELCRTGSVWFLESLID
jgi:hypothetical protein